MQSFKVRHYFAYLLFFLIIFISIMMIIMNSKYINYRILIYTSIALLIPIIIVLSTAYKLEVDFKSNLLKIKYYIITITLNIDDIERVDLFYDKIKYSYCNYIGSKNKKKTIFLGNIIKREEFINTLLTINSKIQYKFYKI